MTPLDSLFALALFTLCAHVGILIVTLVRGAIPQRRHPARNAALTAGLSALTGELLALRSLIGRPANIAWVGGLLLIALALGLYARSSWHEHPVGRVAFHAVLAAPIVLAFVFILNLR